jgi:hypothetical protein
MNSEQSKKLKIGTRVCFDGEPTDCGIVKDNQLRYVTIKWEDGHQSYTSHKEMRRVELLAAK